MSDNAPTPPPSAPQGGAPQAGSNTSFNLGALNIFDQIALGAGAVVFVFSFVSSYIRVSGSIAGYSYSAGTSAWHSYATAGLLLSFVAVALVALRASGQSILPDTVPWPIVTAGAAGLGWFLILIRGLTVSGAHLGWSGWIVVIAGLALAAATIIPLTGAAGSVEQQLNNKLNRN